MQLHFSPTCSREGVASSDSPAWSGSPSPSKQGALLRPCHPCCSPRAWDSSLHAALWAPATSCLLSLSSTPLNAQFSAVTCGCSMAPPTSNPLSGSSKTWLLALSSRFGSCWQLSSWGWLHSTLQDRPGGCTLNPHPFKLQLDPLPACEDLSDQPQSGCFVGGGDVLNTQEEKEECDILCRLSWNRSLWSVVPHTCNTGPWEVEAGGLAVQGWSGYIVSSRPVYSGTCHKQANEPEL